MRDYLLLAVIFSIFLIHYTPSHAAILLLKNGDHISGAVIDIPDSKLVYFETDFGQEMKIPKRFIKSIIADEDSIQERYEVKRAEIVEVKKEKSVEEHKVIATSVFNSKWSGRVNFGSSLQTGNTEKNAVNTDATLTTKWLDRHRAIINLEYNREADSGTVTKNNKFIEGNYDYFLNKKWFTDSMLSFERDDINKIDLRTKVSFGLGYQVFEQDDLNLKLILGPSYLNTKNKNGSNEDSMAINWSADYDQKIFKGMFQVFHGQKLLIPLNNTNNFLIDSKTGIRMPIRGGIIASGQVDFNWDNHPLLGVNKDDTKYSLKLGYEW